MVDAPLIPAQPRRAALRMLPWALALTPFLLLVLWIKSSPGSGCEPEWLEVPQAYWSLLAISYGLPLLILVFALTQLPVALKIVRLGYFPPLDSVRFRATRARQGPLVTLRGWLLLLMPLVALAILAYGHQVHSEVMQGRSVAELKQALQTHCHP